MADVKNVLKNNTQKDKIFESTVMQIRGNIISCKDSFIQISSITQVWVGDIPKPPLPILPILIGGVFGLGALFSRQEYLVLIGFIVLVGLGVVIYKYVNATRYYALNIELASSRVYSFTSSDSKFILRAFNTIGNIISDKNEISNMLINFGDGTIVNESSTGDIKIGGNL